MSSSCDNTGYFPDLNKKKGLVRCILYISYVAAKIIFLELRYGQRALFSLKAKKHISIRVCEMMNLVKLFSEPASQAYISRT